MNTFATWPSHFVLHHSLTKDGQSVSWPAIDQYHRTVKGWADIGYHWGVELAGARYEALIGRPQDMEGAHCLAGGMNHKSWGICLIGDFDKYPPPREQLVVAFERIMIPVARMRGFELSRRTVSFHRHHAQDGRTCPGTMFTDALLDMYLAEFAPPIV